MVKKARKARARVMRSGETKKGTTRRGKAFEAHEEEDHIDGRDFEFVESEATPDAELPPATGGVAKARRVSRGSSSRT
jgi:hypothetical protein